MDKTCKFSGNGKFDSLRKALRSLEQLAGSFKDSLGSF